MSIEELIEELKRQPNPKVPVAIAVVTRHGVLADAPADYVRFDGKRVVIEGE